MEGIEYIPLVALFSAIYWTIRIRQDERKERA